MSDIKYLPDDTTNKCILLYACKQYYCSEELARKVFERERERKERMEEKEIDEFVYLISLHDSPFSQLNFQFSKFSDSFQFYDFCLFSVALFNCFLFYESFFLYSVV
jgi:hypothetical protein